MRTRAASAPLREWLSFGLVLLTVVLSICLQELVVAFNPQGVLAALISLTNAPPFAAYPFNQELQMSFSSAPGRLYVGTTADSYALRASDGSVTQTVQDKLVAGGQGLLFTVATGSSAPVVKGIRERDGALLWSMSLVGFQRAQLVSGTLYLDTNLPGLPGALLAVDPATGHTRWQAQLGSEFDAWQAFSDRIVVWTNANDLTAYSALDGHVLWQDEQINYSPYGKTATPNERVGVLEIGESGNMGVVAMDLDTGALLWSPQERLYGMLQTPDTVYLAGAQSLTAVDVSSGQKRWEQAYPAPFNTQSANQIAFETGNKPIILGASNGLVFIQLNNFQTFPAGDTIIAYRAADGQPVWQRTVAPPFQVHGSIPAGQPILGASATAALLYQGTVYVTSFEVITTLLPSHMTLSVLPGQAMFNQTTYLLTTQTLDSLTGQIGWQTQHTDAFYVP
jgi:outer membrane protein assembly factor BamB